MYIHGCSRDSILLAFAEKEKEKKEIEREREKKKRENITCIYTPYYPIDQLHY